jgi:hypothetical protein
MDLNTLKEYLNIHLISVQQDYDKVPEGDRDSIIHLNGQQYAINHIIGVINE